MEPRITPGRQQSEPVEEAKPLRVIKVHLDEIVVPPEIAALRASGINAEHAAGLAEVVGSEPPIPGVIHQGQPTALGGLHRIAATRLAERDPQRQDEPPRDTIEMAVYDEGDEQHLPRTDWYRFAAHDNVTHGLPLTLAERKAAARRLLIDNPRLSQAAVARACGLHRKTVAKILAEIEAEDIEEHGKGEEGIAGGVSLVALANDTPSTETWSSARRRRKGQAQKQAEAVAEANPEASVQELAEQSGVSESTVHRARRRRRNQTTEAPEAEADGQVEEREETIEAETSEAEEHPRAAGSKRATQVVVDYGKEMRKVAEKYEKEFRSLPATIEVPKLISDAIDAVHGLQAQLRQRIVVKP